jgi:DNA-binding MarR family transcriptional regulator
MVVVRGEESKGVQPRVAYVIGRLDRALRRHLDEGIAEHGLTALQYTTLSVLRARSGLSNAQLARRSFMTPQSMSEVLTRLEQKGLVRRDPDPDHGRILRVELTEAGREALTVCDGVVAEIEETMLGQLNPDERDQFAAWMVGCVRMLGAGLLEP